MKRRLIDAGPLIAFFDKDDKFHEDIVELLQSFEGILYSSWPVITGVMNMLDFNVRAQLDFLKWIELGGVEIVELLKNKISRIIALSQKYADVPMDLADASLIVISEIENIDKIITIDSDFHIYRNIRDEYLENVFIN